MGAVSNGDGQLTVFLLTAFGPLRRQLRELLEDEGMAVVGESGSASEAVVSIPGLCPDVAVVDFALPDGSGLWICREVRRSSPTTRCVVLATGADPAARREVILAGASGLVLADIRRHNLPAAVRRAASG